MVTQARSGATGSHGQRFRKKKCIKCGETLPIFEFQHSKKTKDGFSITCRECLNIPRREREQKEKEVKSVRGLALTELVRNHRVEYERLLSFYKEKVKS